MVRGAGSDRAALSADHQQDGGERRGKRSVPPEETDTDDPQSTGIAGREHQDERAGEQTEQARDPHRARGGDRHHAIIAVHTPHSESVC